MDQLDSVLHQAGVWAKEGQTCTYCRVTSGKPELNDGGKYFAAQDHSLVGYTPAQ
jgi:hypothetical protein